ncbi:hypothetical protein QA584_03920 [Anaerocolumna sp. AGMB13025]|uniref:hypothetical protein n=1 Tax=Anaerocolumna sp. AGMB13025 TaxID=3039116 RepID=UPI00241CB074|nr:hypothetical protein [Anaerocolumna sp. AGMB13025]WFR58224.1 hypothetical protein QA584_03920 [Anaerocolumna sp. AGMB13025]
MKKRILRLLLIIILVSTPMVAQAADKKGYSFDGYTYDFWWNAIESPAAFQVDQVLDGNSMGGNGLLSVNDVCTSLDGRIFLADTLSNRVNIVDQNGNFIKSLKVIRDSNDKIVVDQDTGKQMILNAPEGVFYHEKENELYIANTGAENIIILDGSDYTMKRLIKKPDNMTGVTQFKPSKLTVDNTGRMYVVVQSSYEGIIELNSDGTFSRYFGVNKPRVNLMDYFWKSVSSDQQKQQMKKTFAPAFNNVAIDEDGFVYAVTYDKAAEFMAFRLNSGGKNVLREQGDTPVIGDVHGRFSNPSEFVDIAVTDYGTYAVADKSRGRIFIYDYDGQLLNTFGSIGNTKGSYNNPTGIAWLGNRLVVSDSGLKCVYILKPTVFGETALLASKEYYNGQWDAALKDFEKILKINSNYEIAYIGIGKNYLMKDEYKKAMYYFKQGNNRIFYSKAYNGYRAEVLQKHFSIVAALFLVFITAVIASEVKYHKKEGRRGEK